MKSLKELFKKSVLAVLALAVMSTASFAGEDKQEEVVLSRDNTIVLSTPVDDLSVAQVIQQARKLDATLKSGYPIVLVLNTPGGSIQAGLELIEALKSLNRPVQTLTIFAASMGWQIAQHMGQRNILEYGVLMSHKAYGGFEGEFGGDGISQLDSQYGFWLKRLKLMDEQTVKRTNGKQTLKSYRAAYENELWLSGTESVQQGYADKVVSARCDSSLNGERTEDISFFGMTFRLTFSECPLITAPLAINVMVHTNVGAMNMNEFLQKGGLMGVECTSIATSSVGYSSYGYSSYGPNTADAKAPLVCALDKNLTVERIKEEKDRITKEYTIKSRKRSVVVRP